MLKEISRRRALELFVFGAAVGSFPHQNNRIPRASSIQKPKASLEASIVAATPAASLNTGSSEARILKPEVRLSNLEHINAILGMPLRSEKRALAEHDLVANAKSLEQIDKAFWAVTLKQLRAILLSKRWELRESGDYPTELPKLSDDHKAWAAIREMHPEVLALCHDTYQDAKNIIHKLRKELRPDLPDSIPTEELMINPGGMARLVCYETGPYVLTDDKMHGFSYMGEVPAIDEINDEAFPTAKDALRRVVNKVNSQFGTKYIPENIPGSPRGNKSVNLSGGAITAVQMMPNHVDVLGDLFARINEPFHPWDLKSSLKASWIFIARREDVSGGVRHGYRKGKPQEMAWAIEKWNPHEDQINKILAAANDYWDAFLDPKKQKQN
jgi:hypothetical protein